MSAFKALRDVCNNFEENLHKINSELFSAKIGEPFENGVSKKIKDIAFFSSKLKLLKGKTIAATPQVTEKEKGDHTIEEYAEQATLKVLEQSLVKALTRIHAFKALISSPNHVLDPERFERKRKLIASLSKYREEETKHRHLDTLLSEKEAELNGLRERWSSVLGDLRGLRGTGGEVEVEQGPMYDKLRKLVDKLEVMRWLTGRLVSARGRYDWIADRGRRLNALQLARTHHTVQMFIE